MAASRPTPMLRALDEAPLTRRYWILAIAVMLGAVLEFFDFFLIAFVTPVVADEWDLTYGHAGAILLGAGLGAIAGSIAWGKLGDRYGRKRPLIAGILIFSLATGALAAAPEGGWWWLTLFRFVVGVGVGGVAAVAVPLIIEYTPTRVRSKLVGFLTTALIPIGVLLAGVVSAVFIPLIGWRPLFLIGALPAGLAIFVHYYVRESPRWLLEQERAEEAREVVAWILHRPEEEISAEAPAATARPHGAASGYRSLLRYRRSFLTTSLSWFGAAAAVGGLVLWGPTFLETLLQIDADKAALLFVLVTLGSFTGRLAFSFAPQRFGRRVCGVAMGFGAAPLLLAAGLAGDARLAGVSVFLLFLIAAAFFADGGFANLVPYAPEVFPPGVRAHAMGMAQALNGLGRFVGPLVVAIIAGTGTVVEPEATADALAPAFAFLAACALLVGIAFWSFGVEPHGKDLETLASELAGEPWEEVPVEGVPTGTPEPEPAGST